MKVLIDDKIPYIRGVLEKFSYKESIDVEYLPGRDITKQKVENADALIIRTRTRCNSDLLEGSRVQFIATATIGYDHIDTEFCEENGIFWTNSPGCNAGSVAQYMESVFYILRDCLKRPFSALTVGIVGVGNVGSKVEKVAHDLGFKVLLCDPPRVKKEGLTGFYTLDELAEKCNLLTFHTPLVTTGEYSTFHLANSKLFSRMQLGSCVINTSRGEVVDNQALLENLKSNHLSEAILDVWENEPHPLPELLDKVLIGTPHIAGYSADGKANATRMVLTSFCDFFGIHTPFRIAPPAPANAILKSRNLQEAILSIYDPRKDSNALKNYPDRFEQLRENYPLRREKQAYTFQKN